MKRLLTDWSEAGEKWKKKTEKNERKKAGKKDGTCWLIRQRNRKMRPPASILESIPAAPSPLASALKLESESFHIKSGHFQRAASTVGPGVGESV